MEVSGYFLRAFWGGGNTLYFDLDVGYIDIYIDIYMYVKVHEAICIRFMYFTYFTFLVFYVTIF